MNLAHITAHRKEILPGRYEITYTWEGDKRAPVFLSYYDTKDIPFPLKFIEVCPEGNKYIRTDVNFWWITYAAIQIRYALQWVNARLILTAHIWGLVRVNEGYIPSWKDAIKNRWSRVNR